MTGTPSTKMPPPLLVGMVHLGPTPGAPGAAPAGATTLPPWISRALQDAQRLVEAGFDAVLVENFGDAPFYPGRVPAETVAALAVACARVRAVLPKEVRLGLNVLRNDPESALAIAASAAVDFLRVNVLAGAYVTDQGLVQGRAAQVARARARLAPHVRLFADLRVKHARPLAERPLEEEAQELVERAGADAVIVSGPGTGRPVDAAELARVRAAIGSHPLLVGSGADAASVADLLRMADGVIVGTSIKQDGHTTAPVDPARASAFVRAARAGATR